MKPLDFIKTKAGDIGMITEVSICEGVQTASIVFLRTFEKEKNAWWDQNEFEIIDNLPDLLSRELAHPSGSGSFQPFREE